MKFKTPIEVRGTKDDFVPFWNGLDPTDKLYKSIVDTIEIIRYDPVSDHVAHNKIPFYYTKKIQDKDTF